MEKTKKSIFSKIFICLSLCLVLLGAFAPYFSMTKNEPLFAESYNSSTSEFISSDYWVPYDYMVYEIDTSTGNALPMSNIDFSINGSSIETIGGTMDVFDSNWLTFNLNLTFSSDEDGLLYMNFPFSFVEGTGSYFIRYVNEIKQSENILLSDVRNKTVLFTVDKKNPSGYDVSWFFAIKAWIEYSDLFDFTDVVSLNIYTTSNSNGKAICFKYNDKNGYNFKFVVYVSENFNLDNRIYYFNESLNLTDNEYYNQGYDAGQTDGYNKGYSAGENDGYNNGYKVGNTIGFDNGYNKGLNDSNQYTFVNLIGATIDAPIQYFKSLFNFELLGVNLSGFLLGLFTLAVVISIVRLVLGK